MNSKVRIIQVCPLLCRSGGDIEVGAENYYEVIAIDNERDQYFFYDDSSTLVSVPKENCIEIENVVVNKSLLESLN